MKLYLNHTKKDEVRIAPMREQLLATEYSLTENLEACDIVISFFSHAYMKDLDSLMILTYAACSLRKEFILIEMDENIELPAEIEMLSAKHGLVKKEETVENIEKRFSTSGQDLIDYPITQKYVFKPFEADKIQDADYAFVSYAHADAQPIYDLIKPLYKQGWKLWYDEGIKISNRYILDIANAIKNCGAFLMFVTERSVNRPFVVNFELAYAKKLGKPIIPVIVEEPISVLPKDILGTKLSEPECLSDLLRKAGLPNIGERDAVPPKDKKGEEYDLSGLEPMSGFEYRVLSEDSIELTKYTGADNHVVVKDKHCGLKIVGFGKSFYSNKTVISVTIQADVTEIEDNAFWMCSNLTDISIPDSVSKIGKDSFCLCLKLANIDLPGALLSIGPGAFSSSGLISINLPDSVVMVGKDAFDRTPWFERQPEGLVYANRVMYKYKGSMTSAVCAIQDGTIAIADGALSNRYQSNFNIIDASCAFVIEQEWFNRITHLTEVIIPDGLLRIGEKAFEGCHNLLDINIPDSVSDLGSGSFYGCTSLTSITLGNRITHINSYAFMGCHSLKRVSLGNHVSSIGFWAFYNCMNLSDVFIPNGIKHIDDSAFDECGSLSSSARELIGKKHKQKDVSVTSLDNSSDESTEVSVAVAYYAMNDPIAQDKINELRGAGCLFAADYEGGGEPTEVRAVFGLITKAFLSDDNALNSLQEAYRQRHERPLAVAYIGIDQLDMPVNLRGTIGQIQGAILNEDNEDEFFSTIRSFFRDHSCFKNPFSEFKYETTENEIRIIKYLGKKTKLQIPAHYPNAEIYVTSIADKAFSGAHGLENFDGCRALTELNIPDCVKSLGNSVFEFCVSLTAVAIPDSVASIGYNTFRSCAALESVVIPKQLAKIGDDMFNGCANLKKITIPDSVKTIGKSAFEKSGLTGITLPNGITTIRRRSFYMCSDLKSITIPDSVTVIDGEAFSGCAKLSGITIPERVTDIGSEAFEDTSWFESQPDGVVYAGKVAYKFKGYMPDNTYLELRADTKAIAPQAFYGCENLVGINIPEGVLSIGSHAFVGCESLTSMVIPDSVGSVGHEAISSQSWYDRQPDGLIYAGKVAYRFKGDMQENTNIVIKDGTKEIASFAFYRCNKLSGITIPEGVKSIGSRAFSYCYSLRNVFIPSSVTDIGSEAFEFCSDYTIHAPADCHTEKYAKGRNIPFRVIVPNSIVSTTSPQKKSFIHQLFRKRGK